jgi:hypothetical protein
MADPTKRSRRADLICAAGEVSFGMRWQSSLSRTASVPQSLLAMIAGGDREPTDDVIRKVANALLKEAERVRATADKLDKLAGRMFRELKD